MDAARVGLAERNTALLEPAVLVDPEPSSTSFEREAADAVETERPSAWV